MHLSVVLSFVSESRPRSGFFFDILGQRFAMMEEKVMLSYVLRRFNIESCQLRQDLNPVAEIILRPQDGIHVKLTHRVK